MDSSWASTVTQARLRPAMFIGGQKFAHAHFVSACLNLATDAKIFDSYRSAKACIGPRQFAIVIGSGPILKEVQDAFSWGSKTVITDGWYEVDLRLSYERASELDTEDIHSRLPAWKQCFGGPTGPKLSTPVQPAVLANRLVVAYGVSDGYYCQGFRDGFPEDKSFLIQKSANVGLIVVADLNPTWFTGLPFQPEFVDRLNVRPNIEAEWHSVNDLFVVPEVSASDELARWLDRAT